MFNFEKLEVWQEAIKFADLIYSFTRRFPSRERFGLASQMERAAVSVSSNIAEGSSRSSRQEFCRYVEIATGSLFEAVSESAVASRQSYITAAENDEIYHAAEKLSRMLTGLRKSLQPTG